jgi:hypothetical protein
MEYILDWIKGVGVILMVAVPIMILSGMGYVVIHFVIKFW